MATEKYGLNILVLLRRKSIKHCIWEKKTQLFSPEVQQPTKSNSIQNIHSFKIIFPSSQQ